jgi:hypothetical protein
MVDIALGFDKLISIFLAKEMISLIVSTIGVTGITFALLDMFMSAGLKINYKGKTMGEKEKGLFTISIMLILGTFLPIALVVIPMFIAGDNKMPYLEVMGSVCIAIVIGLVLCLLFSLILKHKMNDKPKGLLLISDALHIIGSTIGKYIADWVTKAFLGAVDTIIKVVHRPFILEYAIVATVLNLVISFMLVMIMGQSNAAGMANLLGSLIGQGIHFILRYRRMRELRAQYIAEQEGDQNE